MGLMDPMSNMETALDPRLVRSADRVGEVKESMGSEEARLKQNKYVEIDIEGNANFHIARSQSIFGLFSADNRCEIDKVRRTDKRAVRATVASILLYSIVVDWAPFTVC